MSMENGHKPGLGDTRATSFRVTVTALRTNTSGNAGKPCRFGAKPKNRGVVSNSKAYLETDKSRPYVNYVSSTHVHHTAWLAMQHLT
jgi:hypothetical protein